MRNIIKLIATFFYIGYLPKLRGTVAAFTVLILYYFVRGNIITYIFATVFLILVGFWVSGRAEELFGKKDAPEITIDDASGTLVALFLVPQKPIYIIIAFMLYRLFDITKPPPIKKIESLKGSSGIMLDDIVAAIYANIVIQAIHYTLSTIH